MIMFSGTIKNAVNLQTLNAKWEQKKASGNILSKQERNERANWTEEDWLKNNLQEQAAQNRENSEKNDIANKVMSGETLTPDEEKYLEQNDPMTLQKYRQIKAEKKAYEEKLKNCKTKDEVQKVKVETLGNYLSAMKKVENNPCIPISEKLAMAQEMTAKTKNILKAEQKFMQSAAYAKLPTEAEEERKRAEETEYENEQNLEQLKEITDDSDIQTEDDNSEDDKAAKVIEILDDIQDSYERIALNSRLNEATDADNEKDSKELKTSIQRKSGHNLDVTV
jgi:hypothetical protein